jgi:L-ascorbate metabolism protein UlaG (beta-lactamase superfamily)
MKTISIAGSNACYNRRYRFLTLPAPRKPCGKRDFALLFDQLAEIGGRYDFIYQALIHLGRTRILGFLVTMDGEQGVGLLKMLKPKVTIPIHYNDYTVFKSTLADFQREVRDAALETNVEHLRHGDTYTFDVHASPVAGF